jgi:hypothetical protein
VRGFWTQLIEGKYEAATGYWPALQTKYGSAAQAGAQLRETLKANPPTGIREVGPATPIPDTNQYRVPFVVYKREGQCTGEWLVNYTGAPSTGFVIVSGGV